MSERYKTFEGGLFFVTLTVIGWIDLFTRHQYCEIIAESLNFCIKEKGLNVYAYVMMPSHIHMVAAVDEGQLSAVLRDFKSYTAKQIIHQIESGAYESRKEWLLYLLKYFAKGNKNHAKHQLWHHNNHPISLESNK
jgi:REP element-mobilizing transposase RayT